MAASTIRRRRPAAGTIAALLVRAARLLPAEWRIWRWRDGCDETTVATHGRVAIRLIQAGCVARTCVKGEVARARETALRRLTRYMDGDNRAAVSLAGERPIVQQQIEPRRWLISVRLPAIETARNAPAPLGSKVKVVAVEAEMLAVVRLTGRPGYDAVSRGDAIILAAIADHYCPVNIQTNSVGYRP